VVPIANVLPEAGLHMTIGLGSQVSVAVGVVYITVAPAGLVHSTPVMSDGHMSDGAVVSTTVTVNMHGAEVLLKSSVAVQVTVVVPIANVLPEGGVQFTVGVASHVSLAVGVNITVAPDGLVHSCVMSDGQVIDGAVVSTTSTVNVHGREVLLLSSEAVQLTVVMPMGKVLPEAGVHMTVGVVSHVSVAVGAVYITVAPAGLVHSTPVMLAGQAPSVGGVVSTTCTVKLHMALLV
jgi:uncharacterized protein YwlG (UPF0340 family)